jgi:diaminohydroxyphosphoribosylaminopyrimidine deaminase/5-amino-6-(5-phosphoribosylamino)uracil reductase
VSIEGIPGEAAQARGTLSEPGSTEVWERILCALRIGAGDDAGRVRDRGDAGTPSDLEDPLWAIYGPLLGSRDLVLAQLGQTLDGRIATHVGHSHFVNGPEGIVHLHRLRALVDAVLVGAGTAIADDPQLTVRHVKGENPVRVVLDPSGRVPPGIGMFRDGVVPTLWLRGERARGLPVPPGVEALELPERSEGGFDPQRILQTLRDRNLNRVLVEGGGITVSRFMAAGALDRIHVTVSPILLGSGASALTLSPVDRMDTVRRRSFRHFSLGEDLLFDVDLRT